MEESTIGRVIDMERKFFCPSCHKDVIIKMRTAYKSEDFAHCDCGTKFWVEEGVIHTYLGRGTNDEI